MIRLGEHLAAALFPPVAKTFFDSSRALLAEAQGLRIRLKLASLALASLPWEYVYIASLDVPNDQKNRLGFLVFDLRLSLTRYEVLNAAPRDITPAQDRPLRVVALLSSPVDLPQLDLKTEQENIAKALRGAGKVELEFGSASFQELQDLLAGGADIFHFAGHGGFDYAQRNADRSQEGYLAFVGPDGRESRVGAEMLAINLVGRGVRLAFLGACEAGHRDGVNAWSGVAPALTQAGVPAVLGMQYSILDENAIAFSNQFYRDLFHGLPIDEAVRNGRLAILNRIGDENEGDWGAPVLYLRTLADGILFPRESTKKISEGLDGLENVILKRQPILRDAQQFKFVFDAARRNSIEVATYKDIHDQLDDLQTLCYERIADEAVRFLDDPNAPRRLIDHKRQLQRIISKLRDITKDSLSQDEYEWIGDLERIRRGLDDALSTSNQRMLHELKDDLRDILETQPNDINRRLLDAASRLNLPELLNALHSLLDQIDRHTDARQWQQLKAGVDALGGLSSRLSILLQEHNQWQDIDRRLRLIESNLIIEADEMEASWRRLRQKMERLCEDSDKWAKDIGSDQDWGAELLADSAALQVAILARDANNSRYSFRILRDKASDRFLRVDKALKRLCSEELRPTGERLYGILEVM